MSLEPGARIGHYVVGTPLGAGGMGEVYRAADTKLGRDIALKVLPADVARDPDRLARFQREAKALAALDHPSIVTVFSVEEADGIHFLTMQLVEGQALDGVIPECGLPIERIVETATALAEALAAAHEKGIVHRDLKPANVMVTTDGRVKVLDFGLAKELRPVDPIDATFTSAAQTQAGVVMGTPAYMSPEQVAGRAVDHRSDIFSLGALLYEMASGHRPFEGASSAELASAILRDAPRPLADVRADLPADLARIIRRCLEKDVRHRLQTARDVCNELRDLGRQSSSTPSASVAGSPRASTGDGSGGARMEDGFWVAVLPFKCRGGGGDFEALAEGLSEDIVTGLSRFSYLRVIARGSTARYTSQTVDVRSVGRDLGARYVMEGSLRQAGSTLRLAVQLVDASSGAHLWAETYDRPFRSEEVLALLDDLAPRVVSTVADMQGVLLYSMSEALRSRAADSLSPYQAVLRSFGYLRRITADEHATVRAILEQGLEKAPGQADCMALLAAIYTNEYIHGFNVLPDSLGRALKVARLAAEAAPSNHFAHYALAEALFFRREVQAFRNAAERAIALNRMDGYSTAYMGMLLAFAGEWERGLALTERGMQLNPNHPGWLWIASWVDHYRTEDYRGALAAALKINVPQHWYPPTALAATYGQLGEAEAAHGAVESLLSLRPEFASVARREFAKWHGTDLVEHIMDGLGKAGLEIEGEKGAPTAARADSARVTAGTGSGASRADEGFWVAVLPFKYTGSNADLTALAEGLSEEIVTGLSRFSYLRVLARSSTARDASATTDVRSVGKALGARYVMEGSLRQAGATLRLAVQVVDAMSGAHLWAETYERPFRSEDVFALQDDLVPRIVSTVADWYGVLPRSMSDAVRGKAPEALSPYEAVLRSFGYFARFTPEEHAAVRAALERAVQQPQGSADAWAMLSMIYGEEFRFRFNLQPDPLGRALETARRAVDASPSNHLVHLALAQALFFRKEFAAFRSAADRAIALNPIDGSTVEYMAHLIAFAGDWEQGCRLAEQARQLNPNHPGWYWAVGCLDAYRKGEYRDALNDGLKAQVGGASSFSRALLAAVYGQLGERHAAAQTVREVLAMDPDFTSVVREEFGKWYLPDLVEHLIDGLRKAGLDVPDAGVPAATPTTAAAPASGSGASRADEGFWVAVLPFKYTGANTDLTALAEGLSEEIVTGMARFSYLRVIARSSAVRFAGETTDVRVVGKELGARYVMEGSLRQSGSKLRVAVQLVDASSGAHVWAETYDRSFSQDAVFELQDDLVPRIVSTVADMNGVLPYAMSEALRGRLPDDLSPYEAVLRSFSYFRRLTSQEHAETRAILERVTQKSPGHAGCLAMLSILYGDEYNSGFNARPDPLGRALEAARQAVAAAPSSHMAHYALASSLFFLREIQSFRNEAERALALNPMDGASFAYLGMLLAYAGEWERGCALAERATQLNPSHPGWYWFTAFFNAYQKGDYPAALDTARKLNMPGYFIATAALVASYGQLGERDAARNALRELLRQRPDIATVAYDEFGKWYEPELVERFIDGLRKAGLDVPAATATPSSPARAGSAASSQVLSAMSTPTAAVAIAVLPFSDMSPAHDQQYLCEGMAEEIMNALVRIPGIRVASRTSAFRAGHDGGGLKAVADALSVGHVLEGSVRTAGTRLRVTAQLTEVASGYHLWSERFDRDATDVFAVQDEIAAGVVEAVKARLGQGAKSLHTRAQTKNLEAYRWYLKGRHLRHAKEDHGGAMRAFEEAVRLDPGHAPSWTGLAESTLINAFSELSGRDACARARKALATAVALEGESADSLDGEALVAMLERRWPAMEATWRRALELQPDHVRALGSFGASLCFCGKRDEGLLLLARARELDPLASFPYMLTGWAMLHGGRPQDALESLDDALSFEKEDLSALQASGVAHVALGHFAEGLAAIQHAVDVTGRAPHFLGVLGWALAMAGRPADARALLADLQPQPPEAPALVSEAWLLGALGQIDEAFDVLARAEAELHPLLCFNGFPAFDPLRADPRFTALLDRLRLGHTSV